MSSAARHLYCTTRCVACCCGEVGSSVVHVVQSGVSTCDVNVSPRRVPHCSALFGKVAVLFGWVSRNEVLRRNSFVWFVKHCGAEILYGAVLCSKAS